MNQIAVANLMMNLKMNNSKTIDENMVRHMILNSIRMYRIEHHSTTCTNDKVRINVNFNYF